MTLIGKGVLAAVLATVPLHPAFSGSSTENSKAAEAQPKLLERSERGPQDRVSVLAMPAKAADWVSAQGKRQVAIDVTIAKPR